ncbi:MAG: hypothetical protein IJ736_01900 [Firmicutes bacterium]|nr:hypothetical protein [Bacillota bacterium]
MVHVGHSSYVIGDKVYFTLRNSNIIGVLSVIDGKFDYILGPLEESPYQNDLYGGICVFNNKIVLCPYNAKKIWMYDICTGKWESFDVPWQGIGRQDSQFTGMYLFNEKVFMFGDHANDIYVFDIVERKGEYILNKKNQMWGSSFAVIEDKLYIGISYINQIIVIDLNSYAQKNIVVSELADIAGIQIVDNMICCIPRSGGSGKLVLLNREGKLVDSYNIPLIEILRGTVAFGDELLIYGI